MPPKKRGAAKAASTNQTAASSRPKRAAASAIEEPQSKKVKTGERPSHSTTAVLVEAPKRRGRPPKAASTIAKETTASVEIEAAPNRGRGRPPKNATPAEDPSAPAKRGRGRPPKTIASETIVPKTIALVKRGRGRPPKTIAPVKRARGRPPKLVAPVKRARGRPPKTIVPVKRGRGRPPKLVTPVQRARGRPPKSVAEVVAEPPKRSRARPAKTADAPKDDATVAPKRRGRPAKGTAETSMPSTAAANEQLVEEATTASRRGRPSKGKTGKGAEDTHVKSKADVEIDGAAGEDEDGDEGGDGHNYWLMKAEPESRIEKGKDVKFSIDDLEACTEPEPWSGVRNAVARNNMRAMQVGDLAFFYHSNCKTPGVAGVMEIVREATVDETAFDKDDPYYDEKSDKDKPKWFNVHVEFRQKVPKYVGLAELKEHADGALKNMPLLKQSRLSVSKVAKKEWDFIMKLAGAEPVLPGQAKAGAGKTGKTTAATVLSDALKGATNGLLKLPDSITGSASKAAKRDSRAASATPTSLKTPATTSKRASSVQPSSTLVTVDEDKISGAVPPAFTLHSSPPL